jgi:nitrous oxidase accessory protein
LIKLVITYGVLFLSCILNASVLEVGEGKYFSSIKNAISSASQGDTVLVYNGHYSEGTIEIEIPMSLIGINNPVLDGKNKFSLLKVLADNVVIKGLTFRDVGASYIEERAAIRVYRRINCTIEENNLENNFFGIYLEHCKDCIIRNNTIIGRAVIEMNSGNAIHLWYCRNILVTGNHTEGHRDGIYLEFVDNSTIENNYVIDNLRYGLHFMFSDHDLYLNNKFVANGAGVAVMYSKAIRMISNEFSKNWGGSSYGLLLKDISESEIINNYFINNTIGIYSEGVMKSNISDNDFIRNGWALKILGSCSDNHINENNFLSNSYDVATNSSRNNNDYSGNFWSENSGSYDLNRDGLSDIPYRPVKLFSYMILNIHSSTILMRSLLVDIINYAERIAPVITPGNLSDNKPKMKMIDHD